MRRRHLGVGAIVYLMVLAVLSNFFLLPSPGISDGVGGWPIVQNDSSVDTSIQVASTQELQTKESDVSLLTLLWEFTLALL